MCFILNGVYYLYTKDVINRRYLVIFCQLFTKWSLDIILQIKNTSLLTIILQELPIILFLPNFILDDITVYIHIIGMFGLPVCPVLSVEV